jgi:hypothetical protein
MSNLDAENLIETAWTNGYTGPLGPRPACYQLLVEDNNVIFSLETEEDQELRHLCLNCLLMDKDFVRALLHGADPRDHLCAMVCMSEWEKVKYLTQIISTPTI